MYYILTGYNNVLVKKYNVMFNKFVFFFYEIEKLKFNNLRKQALILVKMHTEDFEIEFVEYYSIQKPYFKLTRLV